MKIEISDLTFNTIIGILDFERVKEQKVIVNLSFEYNFSKDNFIDYAEISNLIKSTMIKEKFFLIEDAILFFEELLNRKYPIKNLYIKIAKPDIMADCIVSLSNEKN